MLHWCGLAAWKRHSMRCMQVKKTKPELRICPVCEDKVGISLQSLLVHIRTKHHDVFAEYEGMLTSPDSPK